MKTEVTSPKIWQRKLEVEVPPEEFKEQEEKAILAFQKKAHLSGFRKGKAPLSMIRQRFGAELKDDVSEKLAIHFLRTLLEESNLFPLDTPMIRQLDYEESIRLRFSAEIEVEPEVSVRDYKGLKLEKEIVKISREDVQRTIEAIREEHASKNPVETGAAQGHIVEGDIQSLESTGIPILGQKWENRGIELGVSEFGKQVQEQLFGVKNGEERRFRVIESQPGPDGKMHAQEKHYSIKVKSVSEKVLPELGDDFAKTVGNFETVGKMEEGIQKFLEAKQDEDAEKKLEDRIIAEIIRKNDFELPPSMIDRALSNLEADYVRNSQKTPDAESFRKAYLPYVQRTLKWNQLWHKIAAVESLGITDEEAEQSIQQYVQTSPKDEKRIRALYKDPRRLDDLKDRLLYEKLLKWIQSNSKIKEVTVKRPAQAQSTIVTP